MSVVVRMEMPETCFVCLFRLGCSAYSAYSFSTSTRRVLPKPLDEGCSILAVLPENHGRLVDADEAMEKLIHYGFRAIDMTVHECIEDEIATIVPAEAERSET